MPEKLLNRTIWHRGLASAPKDGTEFLVWVDGDFFLVAWTGDGWTQSGQAIGELSTLSTIYWKLLPSAPVKIPPKPHFDQIRYQELIRFANERRSVRDYAGAIKFWKEAAALKAGSPNPPKNVIGIVDHLDQKYMRGYLRSGPDASEVQLLINGNVILTTVACRKRQTPAGQTSLGFAARLDRLWKYVGNGDVIAFRSDNKELWLNDIGRSLKIVSNRQSRIKRVVKRISEGYGIDKHGKIRLVLNKDDVHNDEAMALLAGADALLTNKFGYRCFAFYGTLLGAIREGDFISHDNDVDVIYLSRYSTPPQVRAEFMDVCRAFAREGYYTKVKPFGVRIKRPDGPFSIGLHYGWVGDDGLLNAAYGHHGRQPKVSSWKLDLEKKKIGRYTIDAPTIAHDILQMLYGDGWPIKDPGFSHNNGARKINTDFHLNADELKLLTESLQKNSESLTESSASGAL